MHLNKMEYSSITIIGNAIDSDDRTNALRFIQHGQAQSIVIIKTQVTTTVVVQALGPRPVF
jgi:hypothetical protein